MATETKPSKSRDKEPEEVTKRTKKTEDELDEELKNVEIQVVSKPFAFEGNHEDYRRWRLAISLYHLGNPATFKDKDYSKILNTLSFMKGKAMDWVQGFVIQEDIENMDWASFEKHLDEEFIDVDHARSARIKVLNHRFDLRNQMIQEAFIQFEGWVRQAGALSLGYNGGILIQALEKNMPASLVENLLGQLAYSDTGYYEWKRLAL